MTAAAALIDVADIPPLGHDQAMTLAETECHRLLEVVDALFGEDWATPTECPGWTVKDMLAHLLGMWELQHDADERARQIGAAAEASRRSGRLRLDELTALQVAEHAHLLPQDLAAQLHRMAPLGLAARRGMPDQFLATPYDPQLPGETVWTFGYLFDRIHTRDPWMHRTDITRAIGAPLRLTREHDGRLIADVVTDWASRHGQPFRLQLTGPAGGSYTHHGGGHEITVDAVEFCRILAGRAPGQGLLATRVTF